MALSHRFEVPPRKGLSIVLCALVFEGRLFSMSVRYGHPWRWKFQRFGLVSCKILLAKKKGNGENTASLGTPKSVEL